jgi:hypothetical protein
VVLTSDHFHNIFAEESEGPYLLLIYFAPVHNTLRWVVARQQSTGSAQLLAPSVRKGVTASISEAGFAKQFVDKFTDKIQVPSQHIEKRAPCFISFKNQNVCLRFNLVNGILPLNVVEKIHKISLCANKLVVVGAPLHPLLEPFKADNLEPSRLDASQDSNPKAQEWLFVGGLPSLSIQREGEVIEALYDIFSVYGQV